MGFWKGKGRGGWERGEKRLERRREAEGKGEKNQKYIPERTAADVKPRVCAMSTAEEELLLLLGAIFPVLLLFPPLSLFPNFSLSLGFLLVSFWFLVSTWDFEAQGEEENSGVKGETNWN